MQTETNVQADTTTFTLKRRDIYLVVGLVAYVWGHRRGVSYGRRLAIAEIRQVGATQ